MYKQIALSDAKRMNKQYKKLFIKLSMELKKRNSDYKIYYLENTLDDSYYVVVSDLVTTGKTEEYKNLEEFAMKSDIKFHISDEIFGDSQEMVMFYKKGYTLVLEKDYPTFVEDTITILTEGI